MYTNIIGTQQILITAAFLSVMILLLVILRKKSTVIRASMKAGKRINIVEDTVISQTERLRLLRVDSTHFIMVSAKGHAPSLVCISAANDKIGTQQKPGKDLLSGGDFNKSVRSDDVKAHSAEKSQEKSSENSDLLATGALVSNSDDEQRAFAEKFRSWRQQNDVR